MGLPNVVYKWTSLKVLYITVFVMNAAGIVIIVVMIVSAVKLKRGFGDYLNLVTPGDGYLWPSLIIVAAVLCAPIYAVGVKLCFRLKFSHSSVDALSHLNQALFVYTLFCLASVFLVLGVNAASVVHSNTFHHRIQDSLIEAMRSYATNFAAKVKVDSIQIQFHCCGSKSYREWFFIPWLQSDMENAEVTEQINGSRFISADVPFSCCFVDLPRPCIHHDILKPSDFYKYDPPHRLTIATTGCQSKILAHANGIGNLLIGLLFLLSGYQLLLSVLSRLLQTAHSNVFYIGPRQSRYIAWIIGSIPDKDIYEALVFKDGEPTMEESLRPETRTPAWKTSSLTCKDPNPVKFLRKVCSKLSRGTKKSNDVEMSGASRTGIEEDSEEKRELMMEEEDEEEDEEGDEGEDEEDDEDEKNERKLNALSTAELSSPSSSLDSIDGISNPSRKRSHLEKIDAPLTSMNGKITEFKGVTSATILPGSSKYKEIKQIDSLDQLKTSRLSEGERSVCRCTCNKVESFTSHSRHFSQEQDQYRNPTRLCRDRTTSISSHRLANVQDLPMKFTLHSRGRVPGFVEHRAPVEAQPGTETRESRLKRFCKELNSEYSKSSVLRRRREVSERENKWLMGQNQARPCRAYQGACNDDGRDLRNMVREKFNPADAYNRFRGSIQDTLTRRERQKRRPQFVPAPASTSRRWPRVKDAMYLQRSSQRAFKVPCSGVPRPTNQQGHLTMMRPLPWPVQRSVWCPYDSPLPEPPQNSSVTAAGPPAPPSPSLPDPSAYYSTPDRPLPSSYAMYYSPLYRDTRGEVCHIQDMTRDRFPARCRISGPPPPPPLPPPPESSRYFER